MRFLERFFLSPDFLGFFSDFLAGVFLAGGMMSSVLCVCAGVAGPGGVKVKAAGSSGRRPRAAAPPTRRRRRAAHGQSTGTAQTDGR